MYDVIIRNARILDGTGNPWYAGDVAIAGGKIVCISRRLDETAEATEYIDAQGLILSPGFIDTHTHSDFTLLSDPLATSKIHQGVTTEIVGNCGFYLAPMIGEAVDGASAEAREYGVATDWQSVDGYLQRLDSNPPSLNVAALIGFGNVRSSVMGFSQQPANPLQIRQMRKLVEQNIEEGAFGMSSGLFYAPQCYADSNEIAGVAKGLAKHHALYATHIRDEGMYNIGCHESLDEAFSTAREAEVALHISHLQANGIAAWGAAPKLLESMETARTNGMDVTTDVYTYSKCGGSIEGSVMPRWALEGGRSAVLRRLSDTKTRSKIANEIAQTFIKRGGPELHTFSSYSPEPFYEGKTLAEVADLIGEPPEYAALTLLEKENAAWVADILHEDDVSAVIASDLSMIGSDGSALGLGGLTGKGKPHPRNFGAFPRLLSTYVREERLLTLSEAVRKMTSFPASRFSLTGRGLISEGFWADLVIFNPDTVKDLATFENPKQLPIGIEYVLVNGQVVIQRSQHTGRTPGMALRRQ